VLREYGIGAGEEQFSSNECLIGKIAANELDINVGDTINISSTGWREVEVTGIVQELMDNSIIWTVEAIQSNENLLGFADDSVNGIAFTFKENADPEEIKEEILEQFQTDMYTVAVYNSNKEAYESIERLLETLMGLIFAFIAFGILLLSLFTFSAISHAMMDRELEFLALRAQGIQRRKILWISTLEYVWDL
jgi:ABC-type lipoprotein release transport system permease subunit